MDFPQILELLGALTGLVYIWLEYRASVWLWVVGAVMPAIYIYVYFESGVYANMGLNAYYLLASIYGWIAWKRGVERKELPITRTPRRFYPLGVLVATAATALVYLVLRYTDSTVPFADALIAGLSVVGLWMLTRKWAEQWLVWLVADGLMTWLAFTQGLYPTSVLYGLYMIVAVFGFIKWRREAV